MKKLHYLSIIICSLSANLLTAQNPFKKLGVEVGVITLSKGKYIEFIPYDSIQHIGSVVINIITGHIIELINTDSVDLGYNYRPDVASRWMSTDPLSEERNSWTPYNYCSNDPVNKIDPNGMVDGWIKDNEGNVFWDNNTNSEKEFKQNYTDKGNEDYSYVSDPENPNSYSLPSGAGKLVLNQWKDYGVENGLGGVSIEMSFTSNDADAVAGWTQTFSSNIPDIKSDKELLTKLPGEKSEERLDGYGVQQSSDTEKSRWFNGYGEIGEPSKTLTDIPSRAFNEGAERNVNFNAQSTMIVNGKSVISVGWGFSVTSKNTQIVNPPKILNTTTDFHNSAVNNLIEKIKTK
jgi:hypothetical protein